MKGKKKPKISLQDFARRRRELMALMEPNSIAILPSAGLLPRNGDVEYRFRQDSDFHYLTGFDEYDSVFVLIPGREHGEAILFCRERDEDLERWHGKVTGPERAMQLYGLDDAFPITDIDDIVPGLIEGKSKLYYAMGVHAEFDNRVIGWVNSIAANNRSGAQPPGEFVQLGQYLHELRLFKSSQEIEVMRQAAVITGEAHSRVMSVTRPGMYEYQLEMNPKQNRNILEDKIKFLEVYKPFIRHEHMSFEEISEKAKSFLASNKKVVLKDSNGQCGIGIKIIQGPIDVEKLLVELKKTGNDMVESYIVQHTELMKLSPSGLNTVRIITQLDNSDNIHFLGGRLRITVNSVVDNLAAGNIAAPVDIDTGIVSGPAVYSDITKEDQYFHPITGVEILGFKIPFWKEILSMTKSAALLNTDNRSIGWDVAVTDEGPELLEGNHDWCKLLWQLPAKRGLKEELDRFLRV